MNESSIKILIVEDNFVSRRILHDILISYGTCHMAKDGREAFDAFCLGWEEKEPYNLIFMDIMMPEMNGHEALQKIREKEKLMGIPVSREVKAIMVTALDDPKNVIEALNDGGATSYIVKPITKETVMKEIRKLGLL